MIFMYLCTAECESVMKKALVCVIVSLLLFFIGDKVCFNLASIVVLLY